MSATKKYVAAVERGASQAKRVTLFYAMHQKRGAYYRKVGHEVLNNGGLKGSAYRSWKEEWIVSASGVLCGAVDYQAKVRNERRKMNLAEGLFEPSDGTYRSLQSFFAATVPAAELRKMKSKFASAQLPVSGFNSPSIAPETTEEKSMPSRLIALFIILVLIAAIAIASHYVNAIVLSGTISAVLVLYIVIEVIDLNRNGKLQEKSLVEILKLVLTKRVQFNFGKSKGDSVPPS